VHVSIIGQAAFGEAVFKRLRADGFDIAGVSAPAPVDGGRPDPLWTAAIDAGITPIEMAALKTAEARQRWADTAADLCAMAFVTDILPESVFTAPRLGTIQYHPSLLPLHRGSSAINWAIINGDAETGLTIFWPDQGVDTGPVLLQKICPIGPDDTVGSLYFDRLFAMGVDAMAEAVYMVAEGAAPKLQQNHALATYEPPCRDEHARIRWHEPAAHIYRLIRGCNPQPGAWTIRNEDQLRIFDCRLTGEQEPGMPGRVLRIDDEGFDVRLNGGVLHVLRVQPAGAKKVGAAEWARAAGVQPGFRFR
jgi:methionyl-tRNA formyltransferase